VNVQVHPGVADYLSVDAEILEETVRTGHAITANYLQPWAEIVDRLGYTIQAGSVLANGAPMKPHTDPWTNHDADLATILIVYRFGTYTGNELVWIETVDGDQGDELVEHEHDMRDGDVAVIPSGVVHWNRDRQGWDTHYTRLVVAILAKKKSS
jgi:hypothetical protein